MAKSVKMRAPVFGLGKSDVIFRVNDVDAGIVGDLRISKGGVTWYPARAKNSIDMGWKQFAGVIEKSAGRR